MEKGHTFLVILNLKNAPINLKEFQNEGYRLELSNLSEEKVGYAIGISVCDLDIIWPMLCSLYFDLGFLKL